MVAGSDARLLIVVAKSFFEAIGYKLGHKAAQAKNAFDLMGGTDEESLRAEIRLGRDMAAALLERSAQVEENETTRFAGRIVEWLAAHVTEKKLFFAVHVTAEQELNALALPGGFIFVSWPLLQLCGGQRDEIAFVLGHEMAHIVRRHTLDRIVKDAALSLLLRQSSGRLAAGAWLNQAGRKLLSHAFTKEQEFEADVFAVSLLRNAGGDPGTSEALLSKLARATDGKNVSVPGDYVESHPPIPERIANLRARP